MTKKILVSTDLASRGLDVDDIDTVIHYQVPEDLDTFIHWSGRTARNEKSGNVLVFTDGNDFKRLVKYWKDLPFMDNMEVKPSELLKNQQYID